MQQLTLQQLTTFLAVADQLSFSRAASQLGISKSAVSQAISQLEDKLQVTLFLRSTRRVNLTTAGELLKQQCGNLNQEILHTEALISNFKQQPQGTLRICSPAYWAESRLLELIQRYRHRYPEVKLEILVEERQPEMQREHIDIVFAVNWPAPEDIVAKEIGHTRYVLCASPDYLKQHGTPQTLTDLQQHHYMQHVGRDANTPLISLKKPQALSLATTLCTNHAALMRQCALQGMAMVQLHDYLVADDIAAGKLIEILPELFTQSIPIYMYYQKHRYQLPSIRSFVELVKEQKH